MLRKILGLFVLLALALAIAATASGRSSTTKLKGTVGPGFTIKLTKGGKKVTKLKHGMYTFAISDKASIHNFVLEKEKGGHFEKSLTSISFTGTKNVKVKLTAGKWKYYCKPHESSMFGFFKVT